MSAAEMTYPAFLRWVADLLEQVPEIPDYELGLHHSLLTDDETASAAVIAAHEALDRLGIDHEFKDNDHSIAVAVTYGERRFEVCHVYAAAQAKHEARCSYAPNVQVDVEAGAR